MGGPQSGENGSCSGPERAAEELRRQRADALGRLARERLAPGAAPFAGEAAPAPEPSARTRVSRRSRRLGVAVLVLCLVGVVTGGVVASVRLAASTGGSPSVPPPCAAAAARPPYPNVRVSSDGYLAHSEPMLALNPRDPRDLVGGSKLFTDLARYRFTIGTYVSLDGGCTWSDRGPLPGFTSRTLVSDVSFAFDRHNDVYAAVLFTGPGRDESGIAVSASRDGGRTFAAPTVVYDDPTGRVFSDKPWIAVDQTTGPHSGAIYVAWSYDYGGACGNGNTCVQEMAFARSTDGGRTFSPPRMIEGSAPFCTNPATGRPAGSTRCDAVIGAMPVVLPDGSLAVAMAYTDLMSGPIPTRLLVTTSPDGGNTWTSPVLVATIHDVLGYFPPERYRNETLPAFAADPRTGQLYLAWSDKGSGDADIVLATSRDHGRRWSRPVRVNDDPVGDGANQFQPQLAVAPDGVVAVSFFDTRLDPRHRLIDVFLAQSVTHGASFGPNLRVTTESWDPAVGAPTDEYGNKFIGDYQGLAASDTSIHPFWNDTRSGDQEIFTASIPAARP